MLIESLVGLGGNIAGTLIWESRATLMSRLNHVWGRLRGTDVSVVVVGAAGVGKSALGRLLGGQGDVMRGDAYRSSTDLETHSLRAPFGASVIVAPGQRRYYDGGAPGQELAQLIARDRSLAIVHVTADGLRSVDMARLDLRPDRVLLHQDELAAIRTTGHQRELEVLRWMAKPLQARQRGAFLMSYVNKQDLWWPWRQDVVQHYTAGDYGAAMLDLVTAVGEARLVHEVCSGALTWESLRDEFGAVRLPTASGYDRMMALAHQTRMLELLEAAITSRVHKL
jgi:hypothetical protein